MNTPLVSVGISFYNSQDCLLNAVRSIFAQTHNNWELILVDDGSTDESLHIAQSITDPRVKVLPPDGKNLRLCARLNQITQATQGDYIARMDADDMCHPERFARQLEFLEAHPEVAVVGTSSCLLDKQGRAVNKMVPTKDYANMLKDRFKKSVPFVHPSLLGKSQWFRKWPYDERMTLAEDYELWLRSCKNSVFCNIPDILYFSDVIASFSVRNYFLNKRLRHKIIASYVPSEISRLKAAYYAGKDFSKLGIYIAAKLLGMHDKLIHRRYSPLTPQEQEQINEIVNIIKKTHVPMQGKN